MYNTFKYVRNEFRIKKLRVRGVRIGQNCTMGSKFKIICPQGLSIGNNVYIGDNFYANCTGGLTINDGTIISNFCTVMTFNHDYKDTLMLPYGVHNINKAVTIERNCWIGINVNICPGVSIGENSIIGMGSTVSKSIDANSIFGGSKVIKKRDCTSQQYSLLEVRNVCNPIRYLKICILLKQYRKKGGIRISFDELQTQYQNKDYLLMLYYYSRDHSVDIDFNKRVVEFI